MYKLIPHVAKVFWRANRIESRAEGRCYFHPRFQWIA